MRRVVVFLVVLWTVVLATVLAVRSCGPAEVGPGAPTGIGSPAEGPAAPAEGSPRSASGRPRAAAPERAAVATPAAAGTGTAGSLPTGRIAGRVLTQRDTEPVAGAAVRLFVGRDAESVLGKWLAPKAESVPAPAAETVTGADGRFEFAIAGNTRWRLVATQGDFAPAGAAGTGPKADVEILLEEGSPARVTVLDGAGVPIPDAEARVYLGSHDVTPSVVVRGSAKGEIVVRPARVPAVFTAPGRSFEHVPDVLDGMEVHLSEGYDIAGVVVDDTGAAVAGIDLALQDDGMPRSARTDAAGAFRFERATAGRDVNLWVVRDGNHEVRQVTAGDLAVRFVLDRGAEISGIVVDEAGAPMAGAEIDAGGASGPDGAFRVRVDWRGDGQIRASAGDLLPRDGRKALTHTGTANVVATAGTETTGVRIVVRPVPRSFLRIKALDGDGRVVPADASLTSPCTLQGTTDGSRVWVVGAPPGTAVEVSARDTQRRGRIGSARAQTSADIDCAPVEIRLARPPSIQVHVAGPDGAAIPPSAWTTFTVQGGGAVAEAGGRVVCAPGDAFRLVVVAGGRQFDEYVTAPRSEPREIRVEFPATVTLRGRLVLADGRPAEGVHVQLSTTARGAAGTLRSHQASAEATGADGVFVMRDVVPGRALLHGYRDDDIAACWRSFDLPGGEDCDLGDVAAWDRIEISGRVTAPEGESLAGVVVQILWGEGGLSVAATCDASGRFRRAAPDAEVVVTARRAGRLAGVAGADPRRRGEVVVPLRPVGGLQVRLPAAWYEKGCDLFLASRDLRFRWRPDVYWHGRNEAAATIREAPSGPWAVLLESAAGETLRRDVTVVAGTETQVVVE